MVQLEKVFTAKGSYVIVHIIIYTYLDLLANIICRQNEQSWASIAPGPLHLTGLFSYR